MIPTTKVDDMLLISGMSRYNSRSQGAKRIIPTLMRALKLYVPRLVNVEEKVIYLYCKEVFLIPLDRNQIHTAYH